MAAPMIVAMVIPLANPPRVLATKAVGDRSGQAVGDVGGGADRLLGAAGELGGKLDDRTTRLLSFPIHVPTSCSNSRESKKT
jgi:hypothetical protein